MDKKQSSPTSDDLQEKPVKSKETPNADFLYGLLADYKNKDITKKQIRNERIVDK